MVEDETKVRDTSNRADDTEGAPPDTQTGETSADQINKGRSEVSNLEAGVFDHNIPPGQLPRAEPITITRNTEASAPNITLNRPEKAGRVELRILAAFGILLQLGVVLFLGFITYYPTLRFEKNDRPTPRYAFPLTAMGTFLLVLGMLICAHVVDSSTDETYYKVLQERKVQLVWLQQANKVSDQVFLPVAIHRQNPCKLITTSSRVIKDEHDSNLEDRPDQGAQDPAGDLPGKPKFTDQRTDMPRIDSIATQSTSIQLANTRTQPRCNSQGSDMRSASSQQAKSKTAIEWKAILGTIICLSGFVIQFVGLRSMHWSASIAQLVAVFAMTVLRTVARRGFTDPVDSQDLTQEHELDWFTLTLADLQNASWCKSLLVMDREDGDSVQSSTWVSNRWNRLRQLLSYRWNRLRQFLSGKNSKKQKEELVGSWIVTSGPYDKDSKIRTSESSPRTGSNQPSPATSKQNLSDLETHDRSTAQGVMNLRKDLAQLSNWRGPAAEEAISLAQAMEVVLNTLYPFEEKSSNMNPHFTWLLKVEFAHSHRSEPAAAWVQFHLSWDKRRKWKARADEIEAALSLWLYSTRKQETEENSIQLAPLKDSWLREKGLRPRSRYRQLGSYTPRLAQDLRWWMPSEGFNVLQSTPKRKEKETNQRAKEHPQTTGLFGWKPLPLDDSDSLRGLYDEDGGSSDGPVLAVETYDVTKKAYAKDMFSAFMWAVAEERKLPIDNKSKLHTAGDERSGRGSLKAAKLQSNQMSRMAQDIQNTGLESLYDAYLSIIPPFSKYERLPELNAFTEHAWEQGKECERLQQWEDASGVYAELLDIATGFSEDTSIYTKAVAICVRYLEARESNLGVRDFHDWGGLYDYPKRLKDKPKEEERSLTRRLERLEKGPAGQDFRDLRSDIKKLFEFRLDLELEHDKHGRFKLPRGKLRSDNGVLLRDVMGRTALHYAAAAGNRFAAEDLLKSDASSNAMDIRDLTPLHYACKHGHVRVAERLVGLGVKVDLQDHDGLSPLHLAALNDHGDVVHQLVQLEGSTHVKDNYGRLPIHCSAMEGHENIVKLLKADAKATDNRGRTALHYAAWFGRIGVLDLLMSDACPNVDLEAADYLNATALHLAAEKGHDEIVRRLISNGAKTEATVRLWDSTPLHLAAARGHRNVIVCLVERNPEARKIRDANGRTPFKVAEYHEQESVLMHLKENMETTSPEGERT